MTSLPLIAPNVIDFDANIIKYIWIWSYSTILNESTAETAWDPAITGNAYVTFSRAIQQINNFDVTQGSYQVEEQRY